MDMNAKMSKSKKKKLKKRAKRNQALMEETMQHIEEVERGENNPKPQQQNQDNDQDNKVVTNGDKHENERESAPDSTNQNTKLAGKNCQI